MARRSSLRNLLEYGAALIVLKSLQWTPRALAWQLARVYAGVLDLAIPRLRQVAGRNLSMALPDLDRSRRGEIVDGVFRSIARLLVVFAKLPSIGRGNLSQWIRLE